MQPSAIYYHPIADRIINLFFYLGVFAFCLFVTILVGCLMILGMIAIIGMYVGLT